MKDGSSYLLALLIAFLLMPGCYYKKEYHGVGETHLGNLVYGMNRSDVEVMTGKPSREFQCNDGKIVTYVYGRGYTGCIERGDCPVSDSAALAIEVAGDIWTLGTLSYAISGCITPCQKGHLELFFDIDNKLIGARELPTDRDNYCWGSGNKPHQGYPCNRIYDNRRPSSVSPELLLRIKDEDIPGNICDQFKK